MIENFLIWTYRHGYRDLWAKKYQWYYMAIWFTIFIFLATNRFDYWFLDETIFIDTIYWMSLFLINLNSLYLIIDIKYGRKVMRRYYQKLITYDKVVCCWKDDDLKIGKVYEIENMFTSVDTHKKLKGVANFWLAEFNFRISKLVSLKEQRKLKLKKIGV